MLGHVFCGQNRWAEAEAAFRAAPDAQDVRLGLARSLLAQGRYAEAWPLFESRVGLPGYPSFSAPARPRWTGEPLEGRTIFIWMEQGLGDQIQFARFLPLLRKAGAGRIVIACAEPLVRLFRPLADAVFRKDGPIPARGIDVWDLSMSLAGRFGTTLQTIPPAPYLSAPAAPRTPERVGIVYRANPHSPTGQTRSLPSAALLEPLRRVAPLIDLQEPRGDLLDLAATLRQLDLLISVDTGPAHLAGALGVPCWVTLPRQGYDWRWIEGTDRSPWYPSLRLFRQGEGGWPEVIERVAQTLSRMIRTRPLPPAAPVVTLAPPPPPGAAPTLGALAPAPPSPPASVEP